MMTRRTFFWAAIAAPALPVVSPAIAQPYDANGLDRRTLENIERSWIKTRFLMDQWMEAGRLKNRAVWPDAKQFLVRGTFDVGYRETGKAERIVNGVRTGQLA